jgi:uncharacterized membrane protein YqjE
MIDAETHMPGGPLTGLVHSLKTLVTTLLAVIQTRVELLTNDLQQEVHRVAELLVWALVALLAAGFGLLLTALVVIFVFWDTHRLLAAICVAAVFIAVAVTAALMFMSKLRIKPRPLQATLAELERDRQRLANQA